MARVIAWVDPATAWVIVWVDPVMAWVIVWVDPVNPKACVAMPWAEPRFGCLDQQRCHCSAKYESSLLC
jgi:hypothetical protein